MPGTVTVGCKLPRGYVMRVFDVESTFEPVMTGGTGPATREVKRYFPTGRVVLKGTGRQQDGRDIVGSYAFTHGVDADFCARWFEANKSSEVVQKGFIVAHAKPHEAQAAATAHEREKTGYEPVDPSSLPVEFKNKIQPAKAA